MPRDSTSTSAADARAQSESVIGATERSQMERKHIFCINGSSAFLDVVRALFEEEHYNITTTNFVPLTFDQILALKPDLLIVDVVYGVQAGWALLDRLTHDAATHPIPVIVTSTNHSLLERAETLAVPNGARLYLDMPFDIETILTMVHELIGTA
jgi:CheY-like chemotaxis protein